MSLFGQALLQRHKASVSISQLMLVLSDGRGVFSHGTLVSMICTYSLGSFSFFLLSAPSYLYGSLFCQTYAS